MCTSLVAYPCAGELTVLPCTFPPQRARPECTPHIYTSRLYQVFLRCTIERCPNVHISPQPWNPRDRARIVAVRRGRWLCNVVWERICCIRAPSAQISTLSPPGRPGHTPARTPSSQACRDRDTLRPSGLGGILHSRILCSALVHDWSVQASYRISVHRQFTLLSQSHLKGDMDHWAQRDLLINCYLPLPDTLPVGVAAIDRNTVLGPPVMSN